MSNIMLKVENVYKEYRLGAIGGTTLRDEIQRKMAKLQHKPDPTVAIGQERTNDKGMFMALSDINLEVKKGEAVGIIGHNGAGKSTLLKLITQVTAPTRGKIYLNGRVASMLEVGTGFHPELTGRENIYVNGAILGMTKKEIDSKIEDIIDFSECRQFIDTPVKRYSSGMYVKLAFSVAANLDSEIMIMDEVLAVGDVAFQNKCIQKMKDVADSGRTILYVSHNMGTIRKLCNRCICLSKGKKVFDGDVETAIDFYVKNKMNDFGDDVNLDTMKRHGVVTRKMHFNRLTIENYNGHIDTGSNVKAVLSWNAKETIENFQLRIHIFTMEYQAIGVINSPKFRCSAGNNTSKIEMPLNQLMPGKYLMTLMGIDVDSMGSEVRHDCIAEAWAFEVMQDSNDNSFSHWNPTWGSVRFSQLIIEDANT